MTTFTMKKYDGKTIYGAHALGELEIRGRFHMQGPQPIGNGLLILK